jgi:hypothetical protein
LESQIQAQQKNQPIKIDKANCGELHGSTSSELLAAAHIGQRKKKKQNRCRNKNQIDHAYLWLVEVVTNLQQKKVVSMRSMLVTN